MSGALPSNDKNHVLSYYYQDGEIGSSDQYILSNKLFLLNFNDNENISCDTGQDSKPQEGEGVKWYHNMWEALWSICFSVIIILEIH